jgi:hypothetical protein
MLQERRTQLLQVKKDDLVRVAQLYLSNPRDSKTVILGKEEGRATLERAGFTCD